MILLSTLVSITALPLISAPPPQINCQLVPLLSKHQIQHQILAAEVKRNVDSTENEFVDLRKGSHSIT